MAETTGIAWTDHTWNPWIGCTKVSPGCDHCYAEALDKRHRYGGGEHWGAGVPRYLTKSWDVPLALDRKAEKAGVRRTIFPSMCDVFDNEVPIVWRHDLWKLIQATPHLIWLLLTKRIGNAEKFWPGGPPPNAWIGASVVNQEEADRDIPKLLQVPAAKRFVSYEPALGPVDFGRFFEQYPDHNGVRVVQRHDGIDWLICGGESAQGGAKARPFVIGWAREAMRQCHWARVPFFMKQFGSNATNREGVRHPFKDRAGADLDEWPADLKVQEFPA